MRKVRNQTPEVKSKAREMRREMFESEKKLWALLRNRRRQFKFRTQHAVDKYFLDFYCAEARLCVELDGESHVDREMTDAIRDAKLAELGIATLRVSTIDLYDDPDAVAERIGRTCFLRINGDPE